MKIMKATQTALGDAYPYSAADDIVEAMFNDDRMGRKNGKGFYAYDEKGKAGLESGKDYAGIGLLPMSNLILPK